METTDKTEGRVLDNCTVIEIVTETLDLSQHNDNIAELLKRFSLKVYQTPSGSYNWFCRKCNTIAFSEEIFMPCKQCFITNRVVCRHGCGSRWSLMITPVIPPEVKATKRSLQ